MALRCGWSAGRISAISAARSPARAGCADHIVVHPGGGAHVPVVGGVQVTGGLNMFCDQRRVFVPRFRIAGFDRGGHPLVPLCTIGSELRARGHRTESADGGTRTRVVG